MQKDKIIFTLAKRIKELVDKSILDVEPCGEAIKEVSTLLLEITSEVERIDIEEPVRSYSPNVLEQGFTTTPSYSTQAGTLSSSDLTQAINTLNNH